MTREQIESILKSAQGKQEKDGAYTLPEGASLSLHVAHDGASMAVRICSIIATDRSAWLAMSARVMSLV